jgi:hypothetical protein
MHWVRVSGSIGACSLCVSLLSYFVSLILYLMSFSLPDWIVYAPMPVKIGLWRICDIEVSRPSLVRAAWRRLVALVVAR